MAISLKLDKLKKTTKKNPYTAIISLEKICKHHFQEWLDSGVDPEIIHLNVQSIAGRQIIEHLNLDNLNHWQLQHRYSDVLKGGWICGNTFKSDNPRKVKQKIIKYENPTGLEIKPIKLQLPESSWQLIAAKYGVPKSTDTDGWEWVVNNPQIPVAITEGVKKAGSIITSQLIPTIALPGHTTANIREGDVRFPEFLHPDRTIYLCFDNDFKVSTRQSVANTIHGVIRRITRDTDYKLLEPIRAKLKICQWDSTNKGIDDVLISDGISAVTKIFNDAIDWTEYIDTSANTLGFTPAITFNSPKFEYTELHPETTLIGVKGAKGSGKTWYLERLVKKAEQNQRPIISIVHRIQLAISIANRLGLTYIDDIDGKISKHNSISLVIDSLGKIDPVNFAGGLIVIDEVVQVVEHMLTSDTCRQKRQQILKTLRELAQIIIKTGGQFILADADLNEITLRFFIGLLGDDIEPYIIENTYNEPSYKCIISSGYEYKNEKGKTKKSPVDILGTALSKALDGEKVMLCVTGQSEESRWGSINIEKVFLNFGISSIIRIDSETTKNPEHPAYKATSKINALCDDYQVVIATPSMGTGVSIENKIPFDLICGIFTGVGSPDSVRQFLMRVRDKSIPRLIYVTERGLPNGYSNLGRTAKSVDKNSTDLYDFERELLSEHDKEWLTEYPEMKCCNTTTIYFNNLIATKNKQIETYSKYVRYGLNQENVNIIDVDNASDVFDINVDLNNLYELSDSIKTESIDKYYKQIEAQQLITDDEYTKLKTQTDLTDSERLTKEANELSKRYGGIPATEALAIKDANGWYQQLKLHYACTEGYELIKDLHVLKASKELAKGEGSAIKNDFINSHRLFAQVELIQASGLLDIINKSELSKTDAKCREVYDVLIENKAEIHLIFGIKLNDKKANEASDKNIDTFNFQVIRTMLETMGITTGKAFRKGSKGNQTRVYPINPIDDGRETIYAAWLKRDTERVKEWQKLKKDWEINRLVRKCIADVDLEYIEQLKTRGIFDDIWERVDTDTRIQLINRTDNFCLPTPQIQRIDPHVNTYQAILDDIATWTEISLDIETYGNDTKNKEGLHHIKGEIRLIQVSDGETIYYADLAGRDSNKEAIKYALRDFLNLLNKQISNPVIKIIGQNIHFDLRFLRFKLAFDRARNVVDTMLGAKVFFGDYGKLKVLPGGYGLGNLARKFLGLDVDKSEQKSDWGGTLTQSQIDYAIKDPFVTYHLYKRLLELYDNPAKFGFGKLAQAEIMEAWKLENDIISCAVELEVNGLPFDKNAAENNLQRCKDIQTEILAKWVDLVPKINYTQTKKLVDHLNTKYSLDIKSLNKSTLADLSNYHEIKLLGKLRAIKIPIQQLESFIRSAGITGRVQTKLNTLTGTGRFSSGNSKTFRDLPNLQSISAKINPALNEYDIPSVRTCITVTGTSRGFGIIDLAASHGRIAADVADDETAIAGCNDKTIDNHSKVAVYIAKALGHDVSWEEIAINKKIKPYKLYRDAAKNTYYGWLNGAGSSRVQEQIKANSGQIVAIEACQAAIKGCEVLYPNVVNFRKQLVEELSKKENLLFVDDKYYAVNKIKSVNNRITHLVNVDGNEVDLPYTQCLAAIWSRTEATALKRALIKIIDLADEKPEWELKAINYVHDEINVEFKLDYAEIVLTTVNNIIGDCFAETLSKVHDGRETDWKKLLVNNWSEK
jgi:Domain of unknown function (DUF3854)/3'-5' exonuclease/DNA polymerase family A